MEKGTSAANWEHLLDPGKAHPFNQLAKDTERNAGQAQQCVGRLFQMCMASRTQVGKLRATCWSPLQKQFPGEASECGGGNEDVHGEFEAEEEHKRKRGEGEGEEVERAGGKKHFAGEKNGVMPVPALLACHAQGRSGAVKVLFDFTAP